MSAMIATMLKVGKDPLSWSGAAIAPSPPCDMPRHTASGAVLRLYHAVGTGNMRLPRSVSGRRRRLLTPSAACSSAREPSQDGSDDFFGLQVLEVAGFEAQPVGVDRGVVLAEQRGAVHGHVRVGHLHG